MKRLILLIITLTIASSMLSAQTVDGGIFRAHMEKMLQQNPSAMLSWFRKVPYSIKLGVKKYEYDFYYGVANYYNYAALHGGLISKSDASEYFKDVINSRIRNDFANYSVRSYLYLGAIYRPIVKEEEIGARIFKYVYDSLSQSNQYYYTALFWTLYSGYLDRVTYNSLYQILYKANDRAFLYDYTASRPETKMSMISKLPRPEKYKPKYYTWTIGSSIATLIADDSFLAPLDRNDIANTQYEPIKNSNVNPIPSTQEKAQKSIVNINIIKNKKIKDVSVSINNKKLVFYSDDPKSLQLEPGNYEVDIKVGRRTYKSNIKILSGNHIYTLVVGENDKENILFNDTSNLKALKGDVDRQRNIKQKDKSTIYNIKWFKSNPYSKSLKMDLEKYSYLRGIAYYNGYITGENASDIALNQSESDFKSVIKGNGTDNINASMYLTFINLMKKGDSKISDDIISKTIKSSGQSDYLYPSMLYWRTRIAYLTKEEEFVYTKRLNEMPTDTPIFDYTTGTTMTLSDALPTIKQPVGASILANLMNTRAAMKNDTQPTVASQINYLNMDENTSIALQKNSISTKLNFNNFIYEGNNIIEVKDDKTSMSIMIDVNPVNKYIFTFISV